MIEVLRPGQFTTIQDLGRFGYRSMGVPVSGPMDINSAVLANELLDNDPNAPLIEMAYVGASFLFHKSTTLALAGARCELKLNDEIVELRSVIRVEPGTIVSSGAMKNGNFLYLSVAGGFKTDFVLGSASYYEAVTGYARMNKGTRLYFDESLEHKALDQATEYRELPSSTCTIEVEKGPEFHLLSDDDISELLITKFSISPQSNRMGFLLNQSVKIKLKEIISSPVQPGTVQLTQGGQLVVLMRDAQTTGGYPRILQLTNNSINLLSQFPLNTSFTFELID